MSCGRHAPAAFLHVGRRSLSSTKSSELSHPLSGTVGLSQLARAIIACFATILKLVSAGEQYRR